MSAHGYPPGRVHVRRPHGDDPRAELPPGAPAAPPLSADDLDALLTLIGDAGVCGCGVEMAERFHAWVWHHAPAETREAWGKRSGPPLDSAAAARSFTEGFADGVASANRGQR